MSAALDTLSIAASVAGLKLCHVTIAPEVLAHGSSPESGAWAVLAKIAIDPRCSGWARHESSAYWFAQGTPRGGAVGRPLYAQWRDGKSSYELAPSQEEPGRLVLRTLTEVTGAGQPVLRQSISVLFSSPPGCADDNAPERVKYVVYWGAPEGDDESAVTRLHHWFNGFAP